MRNTSFVSLAVRGFLWFCYSSTLNHWTVQTMGLILIHASRTSHFTLLLLPFRNTNPESWNSLGTKNILIGWKVKSFFFFNIRKFWWKFFLVYSSSESFMRVGKPNYNSARLYATRVRRVVAISRGPTCQERFRNSICTHSLTGVGGQKWKRDYSILNAVLRTVSVLQTIWQ